MSHKTEEEIEAMAEAWPELWGMCGHCHRRVDNADPEHRVTPIVEGGRGVECKLRGDYL